MIGYFIGAGSAVALVACIERKRFRSTPLNLVASGIQIALTQGFAAALAPAVLWVSGNLPTRHLHFSAHYFPLSLLALLALNDLVDYFFHRLEHRLPWLWKMHSFHHSDASMNATTAYRAFWLDRILQAVFFIPLGLVVHADGIVIFSMTCVYWFMAAFEHADLHVGISRVPWLVVTPQYHRLHHSIRQEHYDRNFSAIFPIWDVLFGTYEEPEGFPETGLVEGEPESIRDVLLWPWHLVQPINLNRAVLEEVGSVSHGEGD